MSLSALDEFADGAPTRRSTRVHVALALVLAALAAVSPVQMHSTAVEVGAIFLATTTWLAGGTVVLGAAMVSRAVRGDADLHSVLSLVVVTAGALLYRWLLGRVLRSASTTVDVLVSTATAIAVAGLIALDTLELPNGGPHRILWWRDGLESLAAMLVALILRDAILRRPRRSSPMAFSMMLTGVGVMLATAVVWQTTDERTLTDAADSAAIGIVASANDELTVLATKVSSTGAEVLTVDGFPTFIEVTVRGQQSIVSASLVELLTGSAPRTLSIVSELGDVFDSAVRAWTADHTDDLATVLTIGVMLDLGLAELPNPDGTVSGYLMLAAPLAVSEADGSAPTLLVAAMSIDKLLQSATVATSAGDGETAVDLIAPHGQHGRVVASTSIATAPTERRFLTDYGVNPDKESVEPATFGGTEYLLVSRPGRSFGLSPVVRTAVLSLEALALAALVLALRVQTDRREHERIRREALLAAALHGSPGWTAIVDGDDRVEMTNDGPFHVGQGSPVSTSPLWGDDPATVDNITSMLTRARAGEASSMQVVWSDPSDPTLSMRIVDVAARPLPGIRLAFLQCIDVTEMRDRAMRTSQSERMEAIGVLAGGLAHDFNNLLFITLGYLQMLERQPIVSGDQQARTYVGRAVEAVERGAKVAKSLLSFARSQPLTASRIELDDYIKDLTPLIEQALGTAHELTIEVENEQLGVVVDPGRLSSGLLNVVFNARDAMESKGRLTLRIAKELAAPLKQAPRPVVAISISDTGKGMSPEVAARAFEPFFTTKKVGSGTGLGLATLYSFAQQSGGWAEIDSTEGAGTTVTVYLPPADVDLDGTVTEERDATVTTRALVIDDEPALADLVSAWLGDLGIATRTANTPEAALRVAREFRPQLVVSDANLNADLDGLGLARLLVEEHPALIVVFMTGFSDRIKALQAAGVATLAKPFSREDLLSTLSKTAGLRWERGARG